MNTQKVGFAGITAGAIKKGMVLRYNTGPLQGSRIQILKTEQAAGGTKRIWYDVFSTKADEKTVSPLPLFKDTENGGILFKKSDIIPHFDLVNWVKPKTKVK